MRRHVRGSGPDSVFVVEDVPAEWVNALSKLGFGVDGATATRPVDRHSRHIETAFANLAVHLPAMVAQQLGTMAVPWAASLSELAKRLDHSGIDWMLIGTGALAIRGVSVAPGDIDIITDESGAERLADLYQHELVFPVMHWPGMGLFGRAFDGASVEWLGNVECLSGRAGMWRPTEWSQWSGHDIRVPTLEAQLTIESQRRRIGHAEAISAVINDESL